MIRREGDLIRRVGGGVAEEKMEQKGEQKAGEQEEQCQKEAKKSHLEGRKA